MQLSNLTCNVAMNLTDVLLCFLQLGNFTYTVNMHADPASAETIPQLSAPLGSTATHTLTLDNPVGVEVVLQISCSNPQSFILNSVSAVLPPFGQTELPVVYMPSTLGELLAQLTANAASTVY